MTKLFKLVELDLKTGKETPVVRTETFDKLYAIRENIEQSECRDFSKFYFIREEI